MLFTADHEDARNTLQKFIGDQGTSAASGNASSIARDPLVRSMRSALRNTLSSQYGTSEINYLSQIGVEFTRTGTLQFNTAKFKTAIADGTGPLERLLNGTGNGDGAFGAVKSLMAQYTQTSGMIDQAEERLNKTISLIDRQMADMQRRLDVQRASMVREYAAADMAMTQLKNQSGALSAFGSSTSSSSSSSS